MNKKVIYESLTLIILVIIVALAARFMAKGETLLEYESKRKSVGSKASIGQSSVNYETSIGNLSENFEESIGYSSDKSEAATDNSTVNSSENSEVSNDEFVSDSEVSDLSAENSSAPLSVSDAFYYEPISDEVLQIITGVSYVENDDISIDDLRYCVLLYNDFSGDTQKGEMICNKAIADDVIEIFSELYQSGYRIESIKLVDEFGGDDNASMLANNTSCFNYRKATGSKSLSNHAYGLAIDINPFYNPYIAYKKNGETIIAPEGSEEYADRSKSFPYKIDENDLAYRLFKAHGFSWGGDWNSCKDYQHFEKRM